MKRKPKKIQIILTLVFSIYFLGISNYFLFDNLREADFLRSIPAFELPDLGSLVACSENQLLAFFNYSLLFITLNSILFLLFNFFLRIPPSSKKSFVLRC